MNSSSFDWVVENTPQEAWITWLKGAAGAGKSAICWQSFAEMCIQRGVKVASFFFFRTDSTRNIIDPVVATLAYQIIQLYPETKEIIVQSIEANPLIFDQAFATQMDVLIAAPIRRLCITDPSLMLLLIIDGIDESLDDSSQRDLILTFSKLLRCKDLPVIVLFGSRCESQIQMAFNAREMSGILKQLPLDSNYQTEEDIRRFFVERFADIKLTHPQNKYLSPEWPARKHLQKIVEKSSGQFVYAAVVIKFISIPHLNPSTQLDIVRGLRPAGRATPFAELDALYRHIFSQVDDITSVLRFLSYAILRHPHSLRCLLIFFETTEQDVESILSPLTSILSCDTKQDKIVFQNFTTHLFPTFYGTKRDHASTVSRKWVLLCPYYGSKKWLLLT